MTPQLSIFTPQFDERIRRVEIEGTVYFSVLDVFQHYGKSSNPTMAWKTVLKRLEKQGFDRSKDILDRPVEAGGRPTPFATVKTMNRIAQVTEFKEWEYIRNWMAELANERLEEMANPETILPNARERQRLTWKAQGKSDSWIAARQDGVKSRNALTSAAEDTHETHTPKYAALTIRSNEILLGMTKNAIVGALGLNDGQAKKIRNHLNELALQALDSAELAASMRMRELSRPLTDDEQMEIVVTTARMLAPGFQSVAEYLGINLATGQKLLKKGKQNEHATNTNH